jgi:hypothetical protein
MPDAEVCPCPRRPGSTLDHGLEVRSVSAEGSTEAGGTQEENGALSYEKRIESKPFWQ